MRRALELRWRLIAFLIVLLLDAGFVDTQPWPVVIGAAAYLVLIYPSLLSRRVHGAPKSTSDTSRDGPKRPI